jgi:hypothetical protein
MTSFPNTGAEHVEEAAHPGWSKDAIRELTARYCWVWRRSRAIVALFCEDGEFVMNNRTATARHPQRLRVGHARSSPKPFIQAVSSSMATAPGARAPSRCLVRTAGLPTAAGHYEDSTAASATAEVRATASRSTTGAASPGLGSGGTSARAARR